MNSLANCLYRVSFKCPTPQTKLVVAYLSSSETSNVSIRKRKPINKAMRAYIDRVKDYENQMMVASEDFQKGKRFLATMMGEDPASFSQDKIDMAIEYLLPSSIYQKSCRPIMKPPEEIFPRVKAAKFDENGRPFHFLFFTGAAPAYEIQFEAAAKIEALNRMLDKIHEKGRTPQKEDRVDLVGSEWMNKTQLEEFINEKMKDELFEATMTTLNRLVSHPLSSYFKDFIMKYRKPVVLETLNMELPKPQEDADGRLFVQATGNRKESAATVTLRWPGTGKIQINGDNDILYFNDIQAREQVIYPLQFTGMLGKVDLEATVSGGGASGHAGAIRHATSLALRSVVDSDMLIKMQIAGLLTYERRKRERKKPGKEGARRSYTWLKR